MISVVAEGATDAFALASGTTVAGFLDSTHVGWRICVVLADADDVQKAEMET